jgi:hypothetical protein
MQGEVIEYGQLYWKNQTLNQCSRYGPTTKRWTVHAARVFLPQMRWDHHQRIDDPIGSNEKT